MFSLLTTNSKTTFQKPVSCKFILDTHLQNKSFTTEKEENLYIHVLLTRSKSVL